MAITYLNNISLDNNEIKNVKVDWPARASETSIRTPAGLAHGWCGPEKDFASAVKTLASRKSTTVLNSPAAASTGVASSAQYDTTARRQSPPWSASTAPSVFSTPESRCVT